MLFVIFVHALILIALSPAVLISLLFLPFTMPVLQTVIELSGITAAIFPLVLTETLWLPLAVLADIAVAIGEKVRAVALS